MRWSAAKCLGSRAHASPRVADKKSGGMVYRLLAMSHTRAFATRFKKDMYSTVGTLSAAKRPPLQPLCSCGRAATCADGARA